MTTHDQVLNDLRAAITAIDDGDTDAMYGDQNRGVMQAALETIEALTKPCEPAPDPEDRVPTGKGIKAKSVPTGGLAVDIESRYMRGGFDSPLIYHTRDGHGVWLRSENDRDLGDEQRMWEWFYSSPNPVGEADCIFLGYPSAATPEALRACIDAAAATSSQTSEILARAGLLK